jgi:hypothetical protein
MATARRLSFRLQLLVSLCILLGLFFFEYPPIFLFGYWSWGALAHKTLSGVLIALNLLITQRATKRLGFFQAPEVAGVSDRQERPLRP